MATGSSVLARRIPWTEEPGGLQFTGSQRVHTHRTAQSSASPSVQSHLPCVLGLVFTAGEVKWFILGQSPGPRETPVVRTAYRTRCGGWSEGCEMCHDTRAAAAAVVCSVNLPSSCHFSQEREANQLFPDNVNLVCETSGSRAL